MSAEDNNIEHPSFGMTAIAKVQSSTKTNLFGSSIPHNHYIQIEIHRAYLRRDLSQDHIFSKGTPLLSMAMSTTQFADMITSLNTQGVPCTITAINGSRIDDCPFFNKRQEIDNDFEEAMQTTTKGAQEAYLRIENFLTHKDNIGKNDKKELLNLISTFMQTIENSVPFIKQSFTAQMDRTVLEASREFDAHIDAKVTSLGLDGLREEIKKLAQIGYFTGIPQLPKKDDEKCQPQQ